MTQETQTQEAPISPTPASDELPATALVQVVGGGDGAPGSPTDNTGRARL
jgi:hypothetical protein